MLTIWHWLSVTLRFLMHITSYKRFYYFTKYTSGIFIPPPTPPPHQSPHPPIPPPTDPPPHQSPHRSPHPPTNPLTYMCMCTSPTLLITISVSMVIIIFFLNIPVATLTLLCCRYYCICCLNQFTIAPDDQELAGKLIDIFFTFFKVRMPTSLHGVLVQTLVCVYTCVS